MNDFNKNLPSLEQIRGANVGNANNQHLIQTTKTQLFEKISDKNQLEQFSFVAQNKSASKFKYLCPSAQRRQIQAQINQLNGEIQQIQTQIKQQERLQQFKTLKLQQQQAKYEQYDATVRATSAEFNTVMDVIQEVTAQLETDVQNKQQKAMYEAMANYDAQKDGDFNQYFQKALQGVVPDNGLMQILQAMQNVPTQYISTLGKLGAQMMNLGNAIKTTQGEINQISLNIKSLNATKMTKQTRIKQLKQQMRFPMLQFIQRNEFAKLRYNKVDLNQQMQDGFSRFVMLLDNNNQFHVYDRNGNKGQCYPAVVGLNQPTYMQQQNEPWMQNAVNLNNFQIGMGNQTMLYLDELGQVNQIQVQYSYISPTFSAEAQSSGDTAKADAPEAQVQKQNFGFVNFVQNQKLNPIDVNNLEIAEMIVQDAERGMEITENIQKKLKEYNA